ncbi:50S ribosomal protein L6 [Anaerococcus sp. AGMB00486]|uniref:Large ribosomal subunit protein uL6 n=2 Tax=Anaerococcus TaxID=165779 RepID=A0ABX2NAW0_9FIRM|nr:MULTISPECIES: 50S ribosomal protein L6 [Anaerococcus]MSS77989.1 50S ribosomal protein L6 [Anaerococcus porci]NVF11788.1 50S ribosomal protein L6 [Anaerococcus faecalis]
MSRIGKKPIEIPSGVTIDVKDNLITVKGPKGEDSQLVSKRLKIEQKDNELNIIASENPTKLENQEHGLYRSLVHNMVVGVTEGYAKTLQIEGTGYRAQKQGNTLVMNLGFSHQVKMEDPEGIEVEVPNDRTIIVKGTNKQLVGQHAANIRNWRKPEPYKGKGIRYEGEHVRRKVGKTGK